MVSFYAFPEIFIDTVTALTTCFEHIFFSKKGTLIKRAGVQTPWTFPGSATAGQSDTQTQRQKLPETVQIQQQHKKSAKLAVPNSFSTVHVPIACAEGMKSICIVATEVDLQSTATRGYCNRSTRVAATGPIAAARASN